MEGGGEGETCPIQFDLLVFATDVQFIFLKCLVILVVHLYF